MFLVECRMNIFSQSSDAGDWYDAESLVWLPETQVWWEVSAETVCFTCLELKIKSVTLKGTVHPEINN